VTRDDALHTLSLTADATADMVEARYRELYSEFQIRLTNAPTPPLKRVYQQRLRELEEARGALIASAPDQGADLPIAAPVNTADANDVVDAWAADIKEVFGAPRKRRPTLTYLWRAAAVIVGMWVMLRVVAVARARTPGNAAKANAASVVSIPAPSKTNVEKKPASKPAEAMPAKPATAAKAATIDKPAVPALPVSDNRVLLVVAGDESGGAADMMRAALARGGFDIAIGDDEAGPPHVDRLRAAAIHRGARLLALARVAITPSTAANEFGMASADAAIDVKIVDATTGEIVASRQSHQTGAGTSAVGAASNAVRRGMEQVAPAIASELSARRR
jgi:hypothetical protein